MRRTLLALVIAALGIVIWPATQALAQDTGNRTRGTISALGADSITVKARDAEMKFSVTPRTVVEARGAGTRGRQAQAAGNAGPKLSEVVKTGDAVEVSYVDAAGGTLRATRIRAITSAGATSEEKPSDMISSGTVRSVTANAMTISGPSGGGATFTQSFTIDPSTRVVAKGAGTAAAAKGGKIAITEAVGVGDRVSVSYHEAGSALQASEVRVTVKSTAKPKT
ncbi:MAG TPA: DUF5666 domain-containing protein [Vicinamibacterales bacterium]|jgi:hypothetical protein|nr:DUF5666 domain-containing protein [Vicinamibacterales bacterium]